jgi:O-antigen biosynthesis protein
VNKTSIVIPTYNNKDYSKTCVDSIRKFTEKGSYQIIVVDNHSTDGTIEWLKAQDDLKIILNDSNVGFSKSCNQGITAADGHNDILIIHNDVIAMKNWLDNLKSCLYSKPDVGAVGPMSTRCVNYQAVELKFSDFNQVLAFGSQYNCSEAKEYEQKLKLLSLCMLIKREVIDKVGLLDERFTPGLYEDDDYSYRILDAGYQLLLCHNTFVFHFGGITFKADPQAFNALNVTSSRKFEEKWGFNSEYSSNARIDLINWFDSKKDKAINVLEVGCGCGATLLKIKNEYQHSQLYGIELNKNSAKIASHFADVRANDVEGVALPYEKDFFDYVIFADVLEHLKNPAQVLCNIKEYLKDGAHVLASIPNVMHYSVIRDLLNGNFTYVDAGILDRTHLRFFTLNEINRMFLNCGYSDLGFRCHPLQNDSDKSFIDKLVAISGEDKRVQFSAHQYLCNATYKKG